MRRPSTNKVSFWQLRARCNIKLSCWMPSTGWHGQCEKIGLGLSTRSKKAAKVLSDQAQLKAMLLYTDIACKVNGTTLGGISLVKIVWLSWQSSRIHNPRAECGFDDKVRALMLILAGRISFGFCCAKTKQHRTQTWERFPSSSKFLKSEVTVSQVHSRCECCYFDRIGIPCC